MTMIGMLKRTALIFTALTLAGTVAGSALADIVIGQVTPLSGPLAPTGSHIRAGAQLYFDAVNASGGMHGQKIRLITKDDAYKASETVRLARELINEAQPLALFGFVGTGNVEALGPNRGEGGAQAGTGRRVTLQRARCAGKLLQRRRHGRKTQQAMRAGHPPAEIGQWRQHASGLRAAAMEHDGSR